MLLPDAKPSFRFWNFFLSPNGRVSRKPIWYFVAPIQATFYAISWIVAQNVQAAIDGGDFRNSPWLFGDLVLALFTLTMLWPMFALVGKRLHDVGWTAGLGVAPFVVLVLAIVQSVSTLNGLGNIPTALYMLIPLLTYYNLALIALLAVLPGTKGANRFGLPVGSFPPEPAEHF